MSKLVGWLVAIALFAGAALLISNYFPGISLIVRVLSAFVVAVASKALLSFIMNPKDFIAKARPRGLASYVIMTLYFSSPAKFKAEWMSKLIRLVYLRSNVLTRAAVDGASSIASAGLILALQRRTEVEGDSGLAFSDARHLARKAAENAAYRSYLLDNAAADFPSAKMLHEECAKSTGYAIADELRSDSDAELIRRIGESRQEIVHLFATTGQLAKEFEYELKPVIDRVELLKLYICSPLITTHKSLIRLEEEYKNPAFCTQMTQLVASGDGKVSAEADGIRRVISILGVLDAFLKIATSERLRIYFFTERYPGVKIRLLEKNSYAQVQPGSLSYQNNLYRFGLKSSSSDIVRKIAGDLQIMLVNGRIEEVVASQGSLNDLWRRSITELSTFLFVRGFSHRKLMDAEQQISAKAKSNLSSKLLRELGLRLRCLESIVLDRSPLANITLNDGVAHVSIGMIFRDDGEILLIKKADPFYEGKYSIVAGHAECGESPMQALNRESMEELGILPGKSWLMIPPFISDDNCRHGGRRHVWFVFECMVDRLKIDFDPSEIIHLDWIAATELQLRRGNLTDGAVRVFQQVGLLA